MTWLISTAVNNTFVAALLALTVFVLGRFIRHPAVTHVLWIIVLIKLVTPPFVAVPLPISLDWAWTEDEQIIAANGPALQAGDATPPNAIPSSASYASAPAGALAAITDDVAPVEEMRPELAHENGAVASSVPTEIHHRAVFSADIIPAAAPTVTWRQRITQIATSERLVPILAALWLCGSVAILVIVLRRMMLFSQLVARRLPAPDELHRELERLSHSMGLARPPRLELISGPISPMLWWLGGRVRILFPIELITNLMADERKTLLVHELAHYRRGDHWIRLLEFAVNIIYWWNPVVWVARCKLHQAEEDCCDAWVMAELPESRPIYARALVQTVAFLSDRAEPLPVGASGLGYFESVEARIRWIMTGTASRGLSGLAKVGLVAVALVLLPLLPRLHGAAPATSPSTESAATAESTSPPAADEKQPLAVVDVKPTPPTQTISPTVEAKEFEAQSQTLVGGRGGIRTAAISPDGKLIASSSGDFNQPGELVVWDVEKRTRRMAIPVPLGYRSIVFTPDGGTIIAGNFDGRLTFVTTSTGLSFDLPRVHRGGINSLSLSRDGNLLVTGSLDQTVKLWNLPELLRDKTGKAVDTAMLKTLSGHSQPVFSAAISADGTLIASASRDRTIRIWNVATGDIKRSFISTQPNNSDLGVVEMVAFSPDGKTLAATYWDGSVKLWNVADGQMTSQFRHVETSMPGMDNGTVPGLLFSRDGATLFTGGYDQNIKLWNVARGELLATIAAHEDQLTGISLTADEQRLVSSGRDGVVKVWDVNSRRETAQLGGEKTNRDQPQPIVATVRSADGRWIASAHEDGSVRIRNAADGNVVAVVVGHKDLVPGLAFSPDNRRLATASYDRTVKLWDLSPLTTIQPAEADRESKSLELPLLQTCEGHSNWVMSAAFSPDNKWLLTGSYDKTARLWHVETGRQAAQLSGHAAAVRSVAISPDGRLAATGSSDRTARLWSIDPQLTGTEIKVAERASLGEHTAAVRAVVFSPDGMTLATAAEDKNIKLWDVATSAPPAAASAPASKSRLTLSGHDQMVWCLAFSPLGKTLVSGGLDNTLRVWDPATGRQRQVLRGHSDAVTSLSFAPDSGTLVSASLDRNLLLWRGQPVGRTSLAALNLNEAVRFVGITPDGVSLIAGTYDAKVKLWNLSTGKVTEQRQPRALTVGALSRDGRYMATGETNGNIYLWTVQPLAIVATLQKNKTQVMSLSFSPDGKQLASGAFDGGITIWSLDSRQVLRELAQQELSVEGLEFSPDGKLLASATGKYKEWQRQGTVKLWDAATGQEIISLPGPKRKMRQIAFSDDGQTLVAGGSQTELLVYDVATRNLKREINTGTENSSVVLLPDNKTVAIGGLNGGVSLWNIETGRRLAEYEGHREGKSTFVFGVARSKDGSVVASAGADGHLRLYDTATAEPPSSHTPDRLAARLSRLNLTATSQPTERLEAVKFRQFPGHGQQLWFVVYSPDGKLFATGGNDKMVKLWDATTLETVATLAGHASDVGHAAFSPDGRLLASAGFDRTVRLWNVEQPGLISVLGGHEGNVRRVAFSPSGKWIASAGEDRTVRIWDVGKRSAARVIDIGQNVLSVEFLGDEKRLAVGTGNPRKEQKVEGELSIWDAESGKLIEKMPDSAGVVFHVQSLDKGQSLLAVNAGAGVGTRNVATGMFERTFRAPQDARWAEVSRDGRFVLATHGFETYRVSVWERATGAEVTSFSVADTYLFTAAFSPDGRRILTGAADSTLTVWDLKPVALNAAAATNP